MAGYLHPGKAPIFPATHLVCICDVHVPAYRCQSYYILCVSPAIDLLSLNPLKYILTITRLPHLIGIPQPHYLPKYTEVLQTSQFADVRLCRLGVLDCELHSNSPHRQTWASALTAFRGGRAVCQHGCSRRHSCVSRQ